MNLRRLIFPALGALLLILMWRNQQQASALWRVLQSARPVPLLAATALQSATLLNQPALFQSLYALVGLDAKWREMVPVVLAGRFVNVVTPAAGLGETALLFDQARRRGWDLGRVGLVTTLYFALNFAVFVLILLAGFAYLAARGDLQPFEIFAALPLLIGLGAGAIALSLVAKNPQALELWTQKIAARAPFGAIYRRVPQRWRCRVPSAQKTSETARSFATALRDLRAARGIWTRPIIHAALVDGLEIAVLAACLRAFDTPVSPALLVASYAVATLFTIVSVSPQGLGAVEGALVATLISFGVATAHATAVVLLYRSFSFWLPLLAGFAATRVWSKKLAADTPIDAPINAPVVVPTVLRKAG